ncbi:MAG: aminotransferase class I/II-fold pyridoxal phosphate-dependent enzyme [Chloroflexi bacterium]|nr:aminotransferase class I/II-fold pyridoxal phosphate-dependent enzyme [Chloroflexota bacterium]
MSNKQEAGQQKSYLSQRVRDLAPSGIRKFFDIIYTMDDVVSLGVGEPDFVTPWRIREAAIYSLEKGYTMYTSNFGLLELRQGISRYLNERYDLSYDPANQVIVTVGASQAIDLAMRAILDPGDEVIIPEPTYVSYVPCVSLSGGIPVTVPTHMENSFRVQPADIEARITPRTKAILMGYPNNPTGAVMPRAEMEQIADIARCHDLIVVSDEIYERLVYGVEHICFASLPGMAERTIHVGGFSKSYAMTGWRIGYACSSPEIIEAIMKVHQYTMMCAPTQGQMAAIEALRSGDGPVEEMREEYNRRRHLMVAGLNRLGLSCLEPQGAFYTFPSIKGLDMSSDEFAERLLMEERVALVPGSAFGPSGEGHVRCCYAVSTEEIEEALERMGRFVGNLKGGR